MIERIKKIFKKKEAEVVKSEEEQLKEAEKPDWNPDWKPSKEYLQGKEKIVSDKQEMKKVSMELTERYIKRISNNKEATDFFLKQADILQENNVSFYDQTIPLNSLDIDTLNKLPGVAEGFFIISEKDGLKEYSNPESFMADFENLKSSPLVIFGKNEEILKDSVLIPAKVVNHLEVDREHGVKKWIPEIEREEKIENIEIKYRPGFLYIPTQNL